MDKVYICAPLRSCAEEGMTIADNIEKAKMYAKYALCECEAAPVVSHFFALMLDDNIPLERELGMKA